MRLLTPPFAVITMALAGFSFHSVLIFQRLCCGVKHLESPQRSMIVALTMPGSSFACVFVISDRLQVPTNGPASFSNQGIIYSQ